jgi:stage V sporulation protein S
MTTIAAVSQRGPSDGVLLVSSSSSPQSVAASINHAVYDCQPISLRAIGAGAVNQACKGIAIARGHVAQRGLNLSVRPGFMEVSGRDGDRVSAMVFIVDVT